MPTLLLDLYKSKVHKWLKLCTKDKKKAKQKKTIYKFIYLLLKETAQNKNKTNKKN